MLMEVKRDYRIAIVGQTIKSAIGMKGSSDEVAGLASPKMIRSVRCCLESQDKLAIIHCDNHLLMYNYDISPFFLSLY